jgi:hypothetical protein
MTEVGVNRKSDNRNGGTSGEFENSSGDHEQFEAARN